MNWRSFSLTVLASVLSFVLTSGTLAQEPRVRTQFDTSVDPWIGESRTLVVELLAPGYFDGAPSFHLPDPGGILVVPPAGSPTLDSDELDGTSYTVQRYELIVVSRRGGKQVIPPFSVSLRFKRQPLDTIATAATLTTEPVEFNVKIPAGAESLAALISAHDLKVVETWTPDSPHAKAGDAFVRTVDFTAPNMPAMVFPPFPAPAIDGVGIYRQSPEVLDHADRGQMTGERRDAITYVFERPGTFVIPASMLSWFDLDSQEIQTINFPAKVVEVRSNAALHAAQASAKEGSSRLSSVAFYSILLASFATIAIVLYMSHFLGLLQRAFKPVHLAELNPEIEPT